MDMFKISIVTKWEETLPTSISKPPFRFYYHIIEMRYNKNRELQ